MLPPDPYAFWDLEADHPLDDDGGPQPEPVGLCEIVFLTLAPSRTARLEAARQKEPMPYGAPDFAVHLTDDLGHHNCQGHFHDHSVAISFAAFVTALHGPHADALHRLLVRDGTRRHR